MPKQIPQTFSQDFSIAQRRQMTSQLESTVYDLCVVGGGITGAAVAREAQLRGLKVLLVESQDFASGTSSRSSKLVHGGVRYLEQFEFNLVFESVRERARLWKLAPKLVKPLPFLFPAFTHSRVPLWKLNIGLWLYDILARFQTPTLHKKFSKSRTKLEEPALRQNELTGSIFYWDASTHDALLTFTNIADAWTNGAHTLSRMEMKSIEFSSTPENANTPHKIKLHDNYENKDHSTQARNICFATGPWCNGLLQKMNLKKDNMLAPTRGSHIVVSQKKLPTKHAVVMFHPDDGRVLFSIPWDDFTVIGTTDIFDSQDPSRVSISGEEVDYLLKATAWYYPDHLLSKKDVVSTWSGLRPLVKPETQAGASKVSREHYLHWERPGCIVITGGKLTTHREMAEQTVDLLLEETQNWKMGEGWKPSRTHNRPFPELAFGPSSTDSSPEGILRTQMVLGLEDYFVRRTDIFYHHLDNGWSLLPSLKPLFQKHLGWSDSLWDKEVLLYRQYLELHIAKPLARNLPS